MKYPVLMFILIFPMCAMLNAQEVINLKHDELPQEIEVDGEIKEIGHWKDLSGEHVLVITQLEKGEFFTPSWRSVLSASRWTKALEL